MFLLNLSPQAYNFETNCLLSSGIASELYIVHRVSQLKLLYMIFYDITAIMKIVNFSRHRYLYIV